MIIKIGSMFESPADLILVTTNGTLKSNGALVMGRGAAKELMSRKPSTAIALSHTALMSGEHIPVLKCIKYGVVVVDSYGLFQVKYNWWENADLDLINYSTDCLIKYLQNKDIKVNLNYPGIGNGKLSEFDVYNVIKKLPDNVTVWKQR